jgi:hypothetical protein
LAGSVQIRWNDRLQNDQLEEKELFRCERKGGGSIFAIFANGQRGCELKNRTFEHSAEKKNLENEWRQFLAKRKAKLAEKKKEKSGVAKKGTKKGKELMKKRK